MTTSGTLQATARFSAYDLDMFLLAANRVDVLGQANTLANPETFSVAVTPGTYYLAVSWADDQTASGTARPYTVELR